jgi:hypothetical protein
MATDMSVTDIMLALQFPLNQTKDIDKKSLQNFQYNSIFIHKYYAPF